MARQMLLVLTLSPEEQALWEGRSAMVVAVTGIEAFGLGEALNGCDELVKYAREALFLHTQIIAACEDATCQKSAAVMTETRDLLGNAARAIERTRELLGRAVFVGPQEERGPVQ
jgi:hypothetical protein